MSEYKQPIAQVQYDDMVGTCAADFSESSSDFLKSIGFNTVGRFVVNLECFSSYASSFSVTVSYLNVSSYEEAKEALYNGTKVQKEEVDVSHQDFFKHFKRFSIVLGRKRLLSEE